MKKILVFCTMIVLLMNIGGCATTPMSYKPVTVDREQADAGNEKGAEIVESEKPLDEMVDGLNYEKKNEKKRSSRRLPERQPVNISQLKTVSGPVSINVHNMQMPEFVIYVLGETLKIPFVMDQGVMTDRRAVTFQTPQSLPAEKALEMVIGLLEKHDLIVEEKAGALYVMQKPPAPRPTSDVRIGREAGGGGGDVLQVIPLRHIRTADIEPLIKDAMRGVQIKPYARENVLILHGNSMQIRQIIDFIDNFDVPSLQARKLMLMRLTYWPADEFVEQMTKILEGMSFNVAKTSKEPGPLFVPIRQMNSVLVVAPDDATMKYVLGWKEKLDTVESAGSDDKIYTFAPQYSRASDLVNVVLRLYGGTSSPDMAGSTGTSGSSSSSRKSSGDHQLSAAGALISTNPSSGKTTSSTSAQGTLGTTSSSPSPPPSVVLENLKITADNNKNIVIMICSPAVYRKNLGLLRQLDTQTRQVLIEATIAELTLTDELKYGLEWYINNTIDGGPITGGTLGNLGLGTLGATFTYITKTANFKAMLNAFAQKDKANILSTPRLTVLDNHEALIQVGQDVPIATGEQTTASSTASDTTIQRSIEYRSLGIILRVKPTINTEGLLTLEITQEVSDQSSTTGVGDSPIINVRKINTSVVAAHGQTVALGGLMKKSQTLLENKVPLLGDIPILGHLFKVTNRISDKTELLILVTPTVLTNTEDAVKITDTLKKELPWIKF